MNKDLELIMVLVKDLYDAVAKVPCGTDAQRCTKELVLRAIDTVRVGLEGMKSLRYWEE